MSGAFDEVKAAVARLRRAWETLTPRADRGPDGPRAARDARGRASGESDRTRPRRGGARAWTPDLRDSAATRSRSRRPRSTRLIDSLRGDRARPGSGRRAPARARRPGLSDARARLTRLRDGRRGGSRAHDELLVKISVPSAPGRPSCRERPEPRARRGRRPRARGRMAGGAASARRLERRAPSALLDDAERILRANRAPIEARNQLRALLEAYQVKAGRLGAIEDPELERTLRAGPRGALHRADRPGAGRPAGPPLPGAPERAPTGRRGAAMNCARDQAAPGQIVDGYCDVCGMAPPRRRASAASGGDAEARRSGGNPKPRRRRSAALARAPAAGERAHRGVRRLEHAAPPPAGPARARAGASGPGWSRSRWCRSATRPTPCSARPPVVPESRRFCARCDEPVGRGRDGAPGTDRRASAASAERRSRSSPSSAPASSWPASTRWSAASPTAGWAGSTWPATATCPTAGSCSRGC